MSASVDGTPFILVVGFYKKSVRVDNNLPYLREKVVRAACTNRDVRVFPDLLSLPFPAINK